VKNNVINQKLHNKEICNFVIEFWRDPCTEMRLFNNTESITSITWRLQGELEMMQVE
jgi:hypothetical protein